VGARPEDQPQTYDTPDPRAHYVELDALRGVAISGVVLAHLAEFWSHGTRQRMELPLLGADLLSLFVMGYLGVSLFFLLSGYLLTWTEEGRARRGSYSLSSYAKRRALRLVPAYYFALAVVVLLWPTSPSPWDVGLLATFLHGFKPSFPIGLDPSVWSLTPEVVFYALLPLLVLKLKGFRQRLAVLAALLTVSLATRVLMISNAFGSLPLLGDALGGNRMYFYPTTLLYLFLVGVLLRMMVEKGVIRAPAGLTTVLAVLPVVVVVALPYLVSRQGILRSPLTMLAELMVAMFFAAALLGAPLLKPLLDWGPLAFFGKISYSMFLLHNTVLYLSTRYLLFQMRPWLAHQDEPVIWAVFLAYSLCALAVATVLAYLSYRFVESPFLRRKTG